MDKHISCAKGNKIVFTKSHHCKVELILTKCQSSENRCYAIATCMTLFNDFVTKNDNNQLFNNRAMLRFSGETWKQMFDGEQTSR